MPDLNEMLNTRTSILNKIQDLTGRKSDVESDIFKFLIKNEMPEYFSINWRKLHIDSNRNRL